MVTRKGEEFYRRTETTASFIKVLSRNLVASGHPPENFDVDLGPPFVMNNDAAGNWLFANYVFATDFYPGRPHAIAELGGTLTETGETRRMEIQSYCFRKAQAFFPEFRKVETEYREFIKRFRSEAMANPGRRVTRHFDGELAELGRQVLRNYGEGDTLPELLEENIWQIPVSSIIVDGNKHDNGIDDPTFHSHPGHNGWENCAFSEKDFKNIIRKHVRISGKGAGESENYVMLVPGYPMGKISRLLPERYPLEMGEKAAMMLKNTDFLDQPVESDILGVRYTWNPEKGMLGISPVLSEAHYNGLKAEGRMREGADLGIRDVYVNNNGLLIPMNIFRYV